MINDAVYNFKLLSVLKGELFYCIYILDYIYTKFVAVFEYNATRDSQGYSTSRGREKKVIILSIHTKFSTCTSTTSEVPWYR